MKFTLKDYQDEAVGDVLDRIGKASKRYHEDGDIYAFSLTATTGAGKTVMAAAVFEALFHGDDKYDFDADPGAVVIWFSDDPSLNEQTRFRLMEASDRLNSTDLVVVESTFNREEFEPGKIYFLNTQKLSKNSLLVRGHDPAEDDQGELLPEARPDRRSFTIWDTIQNTIDDSNLTLYLALDEAHRGMGRRTNAAANEKTTIVKRLINGEGGVPPIPIVWGISATVERFNDAMAGAEGRTSMPSVVVDSSLVQESGLLKDTIILDIPDEAGAFETVLVRRATGKLKELSEAWDEYAEQQGLPDPVNPLLVLQVPNTPDPNDIGQALDTIYQAWPELPTDAVAHVFGEHTTQTFGQHSVPYISPEQVQDATHIRILIAKDAISTGWDCPRAEVMVSFRPAKDRTHITQLLGRMVRTPLARRIPGNERLNSVDCLLPFFDRNSVNKVADILMSGGVDEGEGPLEGRRVLIRPAEMLPNPDIDDDVWEAFRSLPSQSLPQKGAKPIKRLTLLAHELAVDGLVADAGKKAHAELHKALEAAQVRYKTEIDAARQDVLQVVGRTLKGNLRIGEKTFNEFVEEADYTVINEVYRRAARIITPDLARTYAKFLAEKAAGAAAPDEEHYLNAITTIAAIGLVPDVGDYLDGEAEKLTKSWLDEHRVSIMNLSDERQESYRQVQIMSADPQDIPLAEPKSWIVPTIIREANGTDKPIPTFNKHLLCDSDGQFPAQLNTVETKVLETEMSRDGFVAWYRNPSYSGQDSLGIAYDHQNRTKIVRPDFVFFFKKSDGSIVADIVDPHGTYLGDALPKAKGIAKYAQDHLSDYRRIEIVDDIDGSLQVLDLTNLNVRAAIDSANDLSLIYQGSFSSKY